MRLNTIKPAEGAKHARKRVGRGIGSGTGKTAGRGHKGQKSRTGGKVRIGYEGGQMPLQMRLPKRGFSTSVSRATVEVRLHELNLVEGDVIDLLTLRAAGLMKTTHKRAKIMLSGEINKPVSVRGVAVTQGAKAAIEAAGGKIVE